MVSFLYSSSVVMFFSSIDGSRTAATTKMERFVIIVNGFQPLTIITKRSILDVAAVLDPPLSSVIPLSMTLKYNYLEYNNQLYNIYKKI